MIKAFEQKIEELTQKLDALKVERDKINSVSAEWAEKRDHLHEEIRKMRFEAQVYKEKRNELNLEVHRLKGLRQLDLDECLKTIDDLKSLRQKVREATLEIPYRSSLPLETEIQKIEWRIQTESLSLTEERKLVEQVKALEKQYMVYKDIKSNREKIEKFQTKAQKLKDNIANNTEKMREIAEQSQKLHEKMIERLEGAKKLKNDADEMHKKYVGFKEQAQNLHQKYKEMLEQINVIQEVNRVKEGEEHAKQRTELLEKLEREALEKLKNGEKLTFEEFKILAEKRKI